METVVIPYRDPKKHGATEHVDAIIAALKTSGSDIAVSSPIEARYEGNALDVASQIEEVKKQYPDKKYVVIGGDYTGEITKNGEQEESVAAAFKRILGQKQTSVLASSYTAENKTLLKAFQDKEIDSLALPEHAMLPEVLQDEELKKILAESKGEGRISAMTAVPHMLNEACLAQKRQEWNKAHKEGKIPQLPETGAQRSAVAVIIPGDVEGPDGKPKLFTAGHARKLANAIYVQAMEDCHGKLPLFLVSNGPRTGKYNEEKLGDEGFSANNPAFHNAERMDGVESNPVAKAFIEELEKLAGAENVVSGCIAKGKVPPQGFLAFYDVLNEHARKGGKATLFIDGVSTTMMAQAANVLNASVRITACDTPAKNATHVAGVEDLFKKGHVSILDWGKNQEYLFTSNPKMREQAERFDDARIIADAVKELAGKERGAGEKGNNSKRNKMLLAVAGVAGALLGAWGLVRLSQKNPTPSQYADGHGR